MNYIYCGDLSPFCVCFLVGGSVSECLLVSGLVDIEVLPMDFLFLWRPSVLSPKRGAGGGAWEPGPRASGAGGGRGAAG